MSYSITYDNKADALKIMAMRVLKLLASVTSCLFAGYIGLVYARITFYTWFKYLTKPRFALPNRVFAPVWAVLFVLMGISVFLVWEQKTTYKKSEALMIFYIQLAANICWPVAFFGICSTVGGLIMILYLLGSVAWTINRFYGISRPAAYLLVPYLVWISYVTVLNFSVYYLN